MKSTPLSKDIENLIDQIEAQIPTITPLEGQYGGEKEYTHQELIDELSSLLTDLKAIVGNPEQFLSLSTSQERHDIYTHLTNCAGQLPTPDNLWQYIDAIKKGIRPFNIRYTKARFLTTKNELEELEREKKNLENTLSAMRANMASTKKMESKSNEILLSLSENQEELAKKQQELLDQANSIESKFQETQNYVNTISQLKSTVDGHEPIINKFVEKIASREQQLEDQQSKTKGYNEQLAKFSIEHKDQLKEAEELISKAKTALGYRQAEGISAAFKTRLDRLENVKLCKNVNTYWLGMAIVFSGIAIYLGYDFIETIKNTTDVAGSNNISLNWIIARFSVLTLPIAVAMFCAGQYIKNKNITEDYAYKTVLAQSIIGFSEQLKDDSETGVSYQKYVTKMLDEIHQHPLRNHKKHSTSESPVTENSERSKEDKPSGE